MSKKKKNVLVLFLGGFSVIAFPIILGFALSQQSVSNYISNTIKVSNESFVSLLIDYLGLSVTILLGIIVFLQSKRINDLEATQYKTYVGIEKLDYSFDFGDYLVIDKTQTLFNIAHKFDTEQKALLKIISVGGGNGKPLIIPLVFITKNQPLIVSFLFRNVKIDVKGNGNAIHHDTVAIGGNRIKTILCDGSRFVFGLGIIVPFQNTIDEINLCFELEVEDQNGYIQSCKPTATLHRVGNLSDFVLTSSYSSYEN